jgi:hypothetical protein
MYFTSGRYKQTFSFPRLAREVDPSQPARKLAKLAVVKRSTTVVGSTSPDRFNRYSICPGISSPSENRPEPEKKVPAVLASFVKNAQER